MAKVGQTIERVRRGDENVVLFHGPIEETTGVHLLKLYESDASSWVFNFKGVTSVNSQGLRGWMLFQRDFANGRSIEFEECSPSVVEQLNLLPSLIFQVRVRSVFVPFDCRQCAHTSLVLIHEAQFTELFSDQKPPRCKKCQSNCDAAELESYFTFLQWYR